MGRGVALFLWPVFAVVVANTGVEESVDGFVASAYNTVFLQCEDAIFGACWHQYAVAADTVGRVTLINPHGRYQ